MLAHVSLWQFDADGKDTYSEDDSGDFEGDERFCGVVSPGSWIKYTGSIGT